MNHMAKCKTFVAQILPPKRKFLIKNMLPASINVSLNINVYSLKHKILLTIVDAKINISTRISKKLEIVLSYSIRLVRAVFANNLKTNLRRKPYKIEGLIVPKGDLEVNIKESIK